MRQWAKDGNNPSRVGSGRYTPLLLSSSEEEMLVIALEESSRTGSPCGPEKIKLMVQSYLNIFGKKTVFKYNLPAEDLMIAFKKRWNHRLSYRKPELLTKARMHSLSVEALDQFFNMLADVYSQRDVYTLPVVAGRIKQ